MENAFSIIGYVVASLGGASVLVFALSGYLGKVWATRIANKEIAEHNKELEKLKGQLNVELSKLNKANEILARINIYQFEKEYEIYSEIWDSLFDIVARTEKLYPSFGTYPSDDDERKQFILDVYNQYIKAFNRYAKNIVKYAPFYTEEIFTILSEIKVLCAKQGNHYMVWELDTFSGGSVVPEHNEPKPADIKTEVYVTNPKLLKELNDKATDELRKYLVAKKIDLE